MGDLGGLTSQLTSSSFGRDVKQGVPCLDAACTVGLNYLSVARNPDKPTKNKLKTKKTKQTFISNFAFMERDLVDLFTDIPAELIPIRYFCYFHVTLSAKHWNG